MDQSFRVLLIASVFVGFVTGAELLEFSFDPPNIQRLRTDTQAEISMNLTALNRMENVTLYFKSSNTVVMTVLNQSLSLDDLDRGQEVNVTVWVQGMFLGHSFLEVSLGSNGSQALLTSYAVDVLRTKTGRKLSQAFTYVIIVLVVLNTFLMGTQLDLKVIQDCVKKPIGPVIGFCCQFIIMPLASFCWGLIILRDWPSLHLGYFAMGCSPGGGQSNFWTLLLDGNLDLSVTMTFFSNIAALAMMPFWLKTLGRYFAEALDVPFVDIARTLAALIVPAGVGLALRYWKPKSAELCRKLVKFSTLGVLVVVLTFGIYANMYIFALIRWYTLLSGVLLPWTGYLISYLVAWGLKQDAKNRMTIAIETGIQNGTIAILLLRFSLKEPDSELTMVMPVCVMMFTGLPLWIALLVKVIRKKCCSKDAEVAPEDSTTKSKEKVEYSVKSEQVSNGHINKAAEIDT